MHRDRENIQKRVRSNPHDKESLILHNLPMGYALHRIVTDDTGRPVDYVFLEANPAFGTMTGLNTGEIIGRKATEVLPGIEKQSFDWIRFYGAVALEGRNETFEQYSEPLGRWYRITAFCPERGCFVTLFSDITSQKKAEDAARRSLNFTTFLSRAAMHFVEQDYDDIFLYIADRVASLVPGTGIVISEVDQACRTATVRAFVASSPQTGDEVRETLGRDLVGLTFDFDERCLELSKQPGLCASSLNLQELAFGRLPEEFRSDIARRFGIGDTYVMPFSVGEDVLAALTILTHGHEPLQDAGLIEAFIRQAAVALQKRRADEALKHAYDDLETRIQQRTAELTELNGRLLRSNTLLEKFFTGTHFLLAYMDAEFNFIRVNEGYALADDKTPDSFTGRNHFDLYPNEENRRIFSKVVETGEPFVVYAKPFTYNGHPERGTTYWDWSLLPVKGPSGRVEALVLTLLDVTQRTVAEQELRRMHQELGEAKRLSYIGMLAATVAHEMRTPLAAIKTALYNIERKAGGPLIEKHIETISRKVAESDHIIQDLLAYSRLKVPGKKPVSIPALLEECLKEIEDSHPEWKVTVHERYATGSRETAADPSQLKMLFTNILSNAFEALEQKTGEVTITTRREADGHLSVTVHDNGVGIAREDLELLFNPFFTRKAKGTGLGLTLCREIVTLHNGDILVESAKGEGTTVKVTIPACAETSA